MALLRTPPLIHLSTKTTQIHPKPPQKTTKRHIFNFFKRKKKNQETQQQQQQQVFQIQLNSPQIGTRTANAPLYVKIGNIDSEFKI